MPKQINPLVAEQFGTPVIGSGERYVLELKGLDKPLHFTNPKDAGTSRGDQYLKGDGTDILILNGVSKMQELQLNRYLYRLEQTTGHPAEQLDTAAVKNLLNWLSENNFDDRYCSDIPHKASYTHIRGNIYSKKLKPHRAVLLQKGDFYCDSRTTQEATLDNSLFISDGKGGGHITNVPEPYKPINKGEKIISYLEASRLYVEFRNKLIKNR